MDEAIVGVRSTASRAAHTRAPGHRGRYPVDHQWLGNEVGTVMYGLRLEKDPERRSPRAYVTSQVAPLVAGKCPSH